MTKEQLDKGNELYNKIEKTKAHIKKSRWMLLEDVTIRGSTLSAIGVENLPIPPKFFRQIAKMIVEEYSQELFKLEQELGKL
jgi:hypothetical protein